MLPRLKLPRNFLCLVPLFTSDECINAFFEHVHFDEQFSCLNTDIICMTLVNVAERLTRDLAAHYTRSQ